MKTASIPSLAFVGLGALLGFVAATRNVGPPVHAGEAPNTMRRSVSDVGAIDEGTEKSNCCTEGAGRSLLLAQAGAATTTIALKTAPASAAKKPNIVVIMGDDIG